MKENFPNLSKETDFQEAQELRESQPRWTKEAHTKARHYYITQSSSH